MLYASILLDDTFFFWQITKLLLKWSAFQMIPHMFQPRQEIEVNFSDIWHLWRIIYDSSLIQRTLTFFDELLHGNISRCFSCIIKKF